MKITILFFLLLINFNSISQIQLGVSFSIDATSGQDDRKASLGYTTGINFTRDSKNHNRRLDVGVLFSHYRYHTEKIYASNNPLSDTFRIFYYNNLFFDVPLKTNLFLYKSEKFNFYFSLGTSFGTYIKTMRKARYYSTETQEKLYESPNETMHHSSHFLLGFIIGVGFEYTLLNNISLTFQPEVRLKATLDFFGADGYSAVGINFGIRRNF